MENAKANLNIEGECVNIEKKFQKPYVHLSNLDNRTCNFWCENGVSRVVSQTIANNAITAMVNHPLMPLRRHGRNLI